MLEVDGDVCIASGGTFDAPASLTAIELIAECAITSEYDKVSRTARSSRFKRYILGLLERGASGKIFKEVGDTGFEAVRDAHLNRTSLHLVFLDGPYNVAGSEGINADVLVSKFNRTGDIEGAVTYEFEFCLAKTANAPGWYEVPES